MSQSLESTSRTGVDMNIGVFVCHCGLNIARVIHIPEIVEYAKNLDGVTFVKDIQYACSDSGQEEIIQAIKENKLDRVVIAACSPKMHEVTFRRAVYQAGLNPYLVEIVNIREQCSWVHSETPRSATLKAKDLIRMGVSRAKKLKPLKRKKIPITKSVLVIGGGVAGIEAALDLADSGTKVYLVEKKPTIGGHMARFNEVFPNNDCSICILAPKMSCALTHKNIEVITNAEVTGLEGTVGNFKVTIKKHPRYVDEELCKGCISDCSSVCPVEVPNEFDYTIGPRKAIYMPFPQSTPLIAAIDREHCIGCKLCQEACEPDAINFDQKPETMEVEVGAIVVATGWKPFDARKIEEYGYGRFTNVITTYELERLLSASGPTLGQVLRPSDLVPPKKVAFIQCVGSRDEKTNPYCSRVCCMVSLKNAQIIKERLSDVDITIFYIDIRAFGRWYEEYYKRSQEIGIKFVRSRVAEVKEIEGKNLTLMYEDTLNGGIKEETFDMVVLSGGMEGGEDTQTLSTILNIPTGEDGFFEVAHPKLRPVETTVEGIYVVGTATGPKDIQDSLAQAGLAVAKILKLFMRKDAELEPYSGTVIEDQCIGCQLCMEICQAHNIIMENRKALINEAACKGCGVCAAACPTNAIEMKYFTDEQIMAQIDALGEEKNTYPLILGFLCWWCGYGAADLAGNLKLQYPPNLRIIRVLCAGRVDPEFIMRAFQKGVDGVMIVGCRLGECHYDFGNQYAIERIDILKDVLDKIGINPRRLKTLWVSAGEASIFAREVENFVVELESIGPLGEELQTIPEGGKHGDT